MVFGMRRKKCLMMRKILFSLLFIFAAGAIQAQEIKWMTMNEALEAQKKEPRKIFMDAYTTWCGPCKMLDKNTFANKKLAAYINKNYYPVKFNAEGTEVINYKEMTFTNPGFDAKRKGRNSAHQFSQAMQITGYPTLAFFDENGGLVQLLTGYRTAEDLEVFLKLFAKDDHKKLKSEDDWLAYVKNFKGEFAD